MSFHSKFTTIRGGRICLYRRRARGCGPAGDSNSTDETNKKDCSNKKLTRRSSETMPNGIDGPGYHQMLSIVHENFSVYE